MLLAVLVAAGVAVLPAFVYAFRPLRFLAAPLDRAIRWVFWWVLPFIPWLIVHVQLWLFDPSFRRRGRVSSLMRH